MIRTRRAPALLQIPCHATDKCRLHRALKRRVHAHATNEGRGWSVTDIVALVRKGPADGIEEFITYAPCPVAHRNRVSKDEQVILGSMALAVGVLVCSSSGWCVVERVMNAEAFRREQRHCGNQCDSPERGVLYVGTAAIRSMEERRHAEQ
jgi:hypothetical protein